MSQSPVLPARFATLFTSIDSLKQSVLEHREAIAGFFAQLGDQAGVGRQRDCSNRTDALERLGSSGRPAADRAGAGRLPLERDISRRSESRPSGNGISTSG